MKNRKIVFYLIFVLFNISFIFAQTDFYHPVSDFKNTPKFVSYFSVKKNNKGLTLGVEIIDTKTGKSVFTNKSGDYIFRWLILTDTNEEMSKKTFENTVFFLIFEQRLFNSFNLKLEIYPLIGSNQPLYVFNEKIVLPEPRIQIVRKSSDLLLPLGGKINDDDFLVFIYDNFISPPNQSLWYFNDIFISNKRELNINDLPDRTGSLKLQVFSNLKERAVDFKSIKF